MDCFFFLNPFVVNFPINQGDNKYTYQCADDHGGNHGNGQRFCSSDPISKVNKIGIMAIIEVSDVIKIARKRLIPAV